MSVVVAYEATVAVPDATSADRIVRRILAADRLVLAVERTVPYCAWCEEAEAPAYLAREGHDPRCALAPPEA